MFFFVFCRHGCWFGLRAARSGRCQIPPGGHARQVVCYAVCPSVKGKPNRSLSFVCLRHILSLTNVVLLTRP